MSGVSACYVFTFKEGILSAVAHDLKIRVTKFDIQIEGESSVRATLDARSLRVECARRGDSDDVRALSEDDKRSIEETVAREILKAREYPEIRFASTSVEREGGGYRVRGELTLCGVTRSIAFVSRPLGDGQVAEATIHQPDFGIRPYRAMLGTLRLSPDVRVRVEVP